MIDWLKSIYCLSKALAKFSSWHFDSVPCFLTTLLFQVNSVIDLMADPLDCIFGYTAKMVEIHHFSTSSMQSRAQSRANKRAHHRHRLCPQEGSSGSHDKQAFQVGYNV
ncbi:hypothetical protein CRYUN_Cryun36dG0056500 [Craigia yunnanensis]